MKWCKEVYWLVRVQWWESGAPEVVDGGWHSLHRMNFFKYAVLQSLPVWNKTFFQWDWKQCTVCSASLHFPLVSSKLQHATEEAATLVHIRPPEVCPSRAPLSHSSAKAQSGTSIREARAESAHVGYSCQRWQTSKSAVEAYQPLCIATV